MVHQVRLTQVGGISRKQEEGIHVRFFGTGHTRGTHPTRGCLDPRVGGGPHSTHASPPRSARQGTRIKTGVRPVSGIRNVRTFRSSVPGDRGSQGGCSSSGKLQRSATSLHHILPCTDNGCLGSPLINQEASDARSRASKSPNKTAWIHVSTFFILLMYVYIKRRDYQ